ncbi:MAG TPA: pyruvate, phosphate dikinase [candidate division Zixibacteria bacterium]|nr:pyruvate, phosphate dikinase [candidate division Zixibacteria bacterium]
MAVEHDPVEKLLLDLQERAKELNCLYRIEEVMNRPDATLDDVCEGIIAAIPPGWQYPDICEAKLTLYEKVYTSRDFHETQWVQNAEIRVQDKTVGMLSVYYTEEMPQADHGPFLKEETKLIRTIADRLGHFLMYRKVKGMFGEWRAAEEDLDGEGIKEWQVVLDLLHQTDRNLFLTVSLKMLNFLCWSGISEAEKLRRSSGADRKSDEDQIEKDSNRPQQVRKFTISNELSKKIFSLASEHLTDDEISSKIEHWIQEDKLNFLIQVVNRNLSISEVADAIRRYHHIGDGVELHSPSRRGVLVSLIRRFLSVQLNYINIAKNYLEITDFYDLLEHVIFSSESHGKLGGKAAGLTLASQIIRKSPEHADLLGDIKIPRTWYITSDMILHFMHYNNFAEVVEQKYKDINQIRFEYPHIVQTFKNSHFPPEMVAGLSVALDDFEERPLIVRSSSLLEDGVGMAFSGKYKSLFLANQGTKQQRLEALMDAIAEVYASVFSPDPIEYRTHNGLIDFDEEMAIMIQEVVGNRVGDYFLPTFAGVGFSRNEFRWSPRIKRENGLLRLVPGLGTRAVDRLSDDYPILIAPGQPDLRANTSIDEQLRYSPRQIDVINLKENSFYTMGINDLLKEAGSQIPGITKILSVHKDDQIKKPIAFNIDYENDDLIVTFDGLVSDGKFIPQVRTLMKLLEKELDRPVDIEFAHDGKNFYLLQCRPQSYVEQDTGDKIPREIEPDDVIFSAHKYISNGKVPEITHIVYVDPGGYADINELNELLAVGRVVNKLNKLLPEHGFILMGPGRWGSRGDIKLGVNVTYSDINNTAMLIEIARQKGNYVPDLSFGTHFFQDLVESNIRYLPLYPDDPGIKFNEDFLLNSPNLLPELLPDYAHLSECVHVIDVPAVTGGKVLRVYLNADQREGVGVLEDPR